MWRINAIFYLYWCYAVNYEDKTIEYSELQELGAHWVVVIGQVDFLGKHEKIEIKRG